MHIGQLGEPMISTVDMITNECYAFMVHFSQRGQTNANMLCFTKMKPCRPGKTAFKMYHNCSLAHILGNIKTLI